MMTHLTRRRFILVGATVFLILALAGGLLWFWMHRAGVITVFPLALHSSTISMITAGPDGNLWFTANNTGLIGRLTPTGSQVLFPTGGYCCPEAITTGPDGHLWFTIPKADPPVIVRISIGGGAFTVFPLPTTPLTGSRCAPEGIAAGPDHALWFTCPFTHLIGRLSLDGAFTFFSLDHRSSGNLGPVAITVGPDGNLWFTDPGASRIGRISTRGVMTLFSVPPLSQDLAYNITSSDLNALTVGPDGNLWFTEDAGSHTIGRVSPSGIVTEFSVPQPQYFGGRGAITTGPDGHLWLTDGAEIWRVSPGGDFTKFSLFHYDLAPDAITAGPDGRLWFAGYGDAVGAITSGQ